MPSGPRMQPCPAAHRKYGIWPPPARPLQIALSVATEAVVVADHHGVYPDAADEHIAHILRRMHARELPAEGYHQQVIQSGCFQLRHLLLLRIQELQVVIAWEEHHAWVRVEREEHAFAALLLPPCGQALQNFAVAAVYTIEVARGEHRTANVLESGDVGVDVHERCEGRGWRGPPSSVTEKCIVYLYYRPNVTCIAQ